MTAMSTPNQLCSIGKYEEQCQSAAMCSGVLRERTGLTETDIRLLRIRTGSKIFKKKQNVPIIIRNFWDSTHLIRDFAAMLWENILG